ncbi:CDP-archaeol synthase [Massilia glaciei]|uniref:CDP-archaeol synthase n=1 Tax=Massilia glaciei TaxID=1524097 RepID=UPI0015E7E928|nr:CDP-archaeol synthase [Massilia glaciei]
MSAALAPLAPPALACAVFVSLALALAGVAHVAWLRSAWSRRFAVPLDGAATWRGRPLFGANKTWRGLMVLPPAAALGFAGAAQFRESLPDWLAAGVWPLPASHMALAGLLCGLAFMLAELPNSLLKRQLGVAPGQAARGPLLRLWCLVVDRVDSTLGALIALSLLLPLPAMAWLWVPLFGISLHWIFSYCMYLLKLKPRPS